MTATAPPAPIDTFLKAHDLLLLDGALATELERRGADLRDPLWSAKCLIESPDMIRAVHTEYFEAGADVATTATYQATFEGFERCGIDRATAARLMRKAVTLAIDARDQFWAVAANREARTRPLVAASIGPYGAFLADGSEYRGGYSISDRELREFHRTRLDLLTDSGADVLACETIPCLREAMVLAELIEESSSLSAWISFSCRDAGRDCEGEDIGRCAAALRPFSTIVAVGLNCSNPDHAALLLRRMRANTDKPLVAYPNSGEHYDAAAKTWGGADGANRFVEQALSWYEAGARLIGGCCRIGPRDIAALRIEALRSGVLRTEAATQNAQTGS